MAFWGRNKLFPSINFAISSLTCSQWSSCYRKLLWQIKIPLFGAGNYRNKFWLQTKLYGSLMFMVRSILWWASAEWNCWSRLHNSNHHHHCPGLSCYQTWRRSHYKVEGCMSLMYKTNACQNRDSRQSWPAFSEWGRLHCMDLLPLF